MIRGVAPLTVMALLILGSGNALLLAFTAAEILQDDDVLTPKAEWKPTLSASAERLAKVPPITDYQQTIKHPIFFKSRQPFVPPPPPLPPAPPPPPIARVSPPPPPVVDPGLVLGGVMISRDTKKAYIFRKGDPRGSWLTQGEEIMGWKVQSINDGDAKLQKDGRTIELPLYAQQ